MVRAGLADPGTMRPLHPQLPKGARVYLPDEAARKRHVEARLLDVFTRWGYREIVTSTFEYADVLAMGTDESVQENIDRKSTRLNSSHGYISYAVFCLKKKKHPH